MIQADAIASSIISEFRKLAPNRRPAVRGNGVHEWVPLSGIVAEFSDGRLMCLALATGMKCLPVSKLPSANGVGIHDWHAEVLALRAFNRFVLQECLNLLQGNPSEFLRLRQAEDISGLVDDSQPFCWHDGVSLHMYCSEAPCGDASMELTMAAQDDASPWIMPEVAEGAKDADLTPGQPLLAGRGFFSQLGTVRRKPGRGDAPPTLSKSCSDKLALRQCTSLLCGLASLLVLPTPGLYLRSVVLPAQQYSESGCQRCFSAEPGSGRMNPLAGSVWPGGYVFIPFSIQTTNFEFVYSKRSVSDSQSPSSPASASSNLAVVWTRHGVDECLVNGVLRGRKAFDPRGASSVSRRKMWLLFCEVVHVVQVQGAAQQQQLLQLQQVLSADTYAALKSSSSLAARDRVKHDVKAAALRGWVRNSGADDWSLPTVGQ